MTAHIHRGGQAELGSTTVSFNRNNLYLCRDADRKLP